jgi:hypothetical protein
MPRSRKLDPPITPIQDSVHSLTIDQAKGTANLYWVVSVAA